MKRRRDDSYDQYKISDSLDLDKIKGTANYSKIYYHLKSKYEDYLLNSNKRLEFKPLIYEKAEVKKSSGDELYDFFQKTLGDFECTRSPNQKKFHEKFTQACVQHIYGKDYELNRRTLLKKFKCDELKRQVFVVAPRRFGKTWSVSMFLAAFLYCIPGKIISVFSTGRRASQALKDIVMKFFEQLPESKGMIQSYNAEEVRVQPKNTSKLLEQTVAKFYPSSVRGLKGVTADVIILEEAAQLDLAVFYEVIVPLLGVENTCVLGISTPLEATNFYSVLVNKKHNVTGKFLFESFKIQLLCEECRSKNKLDCKHKLDELPTWKPQESQKMVEMLMEDVPDLYAREVMGEFVSGERTIFLDKHILQLKESSQVKHKYLSDNVLYTAIDPNGGGKGSDLAIVTFYNEGGQVHIVAITSAATRDVNDEKEAFKTHFRQLRSIPQYHPKNQEYPPTNVIIIEANLSWLVSHQQREHLYDIVEESRRHSLQPIGPFYVMESKDVIKKHTNSGNMGKGDAKVGLWTTREVKEASAEKVKNLLKHNAIRFCEDYEDIMTEKLRKLFCSQLTNYKREFHDRPNDIIGTAKTKLTGKGSGRDDVVMSFMFGLYWKDMFEDDDCYYEVRQSIGMSY